MKLYTHPFSTAARRIHIAALEKQIPLEEVVVDMVARGHKEPAYLKLNPMGKVPVLVDGDFVLCESTAILEYLEAKHPEQPLLPAGAQGRGLAAMHMKMCDLYFVPPAARIVFPRRFMPKEKWNVEDQGKARGEIEKFFGVLETYIAGKDFLVENRFSLADLIYIPWVHFLPLMEITPPPGIAAWCARIQDRDSSRKTRPEK